MKAIWKRIAGIALPVLALSLFVAACDSSSGMTGGDTEIDSVDQSVAIIAQDLELSADETAALSSSFSRFEGRSHEPGFLWRVAAELQQRLTAEQKARLFERARRAAENRRGNNGFDRSGHGGGMGPRGSGGQNGSSGFGHGGPGQGGFGQGGMNGAIGAGGDFRGPRFENLAEELELTEEQMAAFIAIREANRLTVGDLIRQRRDGTLSMEEFRAQMTELRDSVQAEIEALLTDEQKAKLEELKAEREAERAERQAEREANQEAARLVMIEVLGLTDAQVSDLETWHTDAEIFRESIRDMVDGGATREEVQSLVEEFRADHEGALAEILDDTQMEIFLIHGILVRHMPRRGGSDSGGQNGPGFGGSNGSGGFPGMMGRRGRSNRGTHG